MNDDDSSLDEIEKIIPSPKINKNTKDLFSEEDDSKFDLDLKNNNLDNFGDISQINNDQENSLIINNKNSKLSSTNENTENSKKNKISEEIIKNSNDFNCFYFNNRKNTTRLKKKIIPNINLIIIIRNIFVYLMTIIKSSIRIYPIYI